MAGAETVYIRGEGGVVKAHDLPLPWGVQDRLDRGQVVQVASPEEPAVLVEPGAPETPETPEPERVLLTRPPVNDPKDAWAAWAMQVDPDLTVEDTMAMTKVDLIKRY